MKMRELKTPKGLSVLPTFILGVLPGTDATQEIIGGERFCFCNSPEVWEHN